MRGVFRQCVFLYAPSGLIFVWIAFCIQASDTETAFHQCGFFGGEIDRIFERISFHSCSNCIDRVYAVYSIC